MKKYLMTGIAAVAMCAAFTSCSNDKDFEQLTQVQIDESKYEAAFESRFGKPADNHDWGFAQFREGAAARTRASINVNGNEEKYENAPSLGSTEEADVVAYVQSLSVKPNNNPINLTNYFVTQVHTGTETYGNGDGAAGIKGSAHMDNLQILMTAGGSVSNGNLVGDWEHINNFNRADNTDWDGNTLVEDGGTYNFAYNGSEDAKYHDRWIAIDGKDVPKTGGGNYAGYYYVCFDFEATVEGYTPITNASYFNPYRDNGHGQWLNFNNINLPGRWTVEDIKNSDLVYEIDLYDQNNVYKETKTLHFNNPNEVKNIQVGNFVGGNQAIEPNSSYLDWIVRLVKAEPKDNGEDTSEEELPDADVRVIVEDLAASESWDGQEFTGDFDFNDVVFDVIYNYNNTNKSAIILQAAGGTLPLYVAGYEVHEQFGVDTNVMVNTGMGPSKSPVLIELGTKYSDANDILVQVSKPGYEGLVTLTAEPARAPHKIAVPPTFDWMGERQDIESVYKGFANWVQDSNSRWY